MSILLQSPPAPMDQWSSLMGLLVGAVSLIGTVAFILKWLKPTMGKIGRNVSSLMRVPETLASQDRVLEVIKSEIATNGGGSIKDAVKRIEDLAIRSDKQIHFSFESNPIAFYECDNKGMCIWTNLSLRSLFGLDVEQIKGDGWLSALHPDDIEPAWQKWSRAISEWVPYKARYRIINQKSKETIFVETSAEAIRGSKGSIISIWGTIVPVADPSDTETKI